MEFVFNINRLLFSEMTVLNNRLMSYSKKCQNEVSSGDAYNQILSVIDKMGHGSAKAQGLSSVITTGRKLEFSDHILYLMKEEETNGGKGTCVGILKVGTKKLFVYDRQGNQHEVEPLCVLDFYVHESRQRLGYGKKLFKYMLENENIKPQHLAIDRPSHKFSAFLEKHYHLKAPIPQVNNFAVFEGFFHNRPVTVKKPNSGKPPLHPYKRPNIHSGVPNPGSDLYFDRPMSNSIVPLSQLEKEKEMLKDIQIPSQRSDSQDNMAAALRGLQKSNSMDLDISNLAVDESRGYGAQASRYSRYATATPPPKPCSRPGSGSRTSNVQMQNVNPSSRDDTPKNINLNVGDDLSNLGRRRGASPPMLRRNGPSRDYLSFTNSLNAHREYQTSKGHLKVTSAASAAENTIQSESSLYVQRTNPITGLEHTIQQTKPAAAKPVQNDNSWHVMGVPSSYQSHAAKKYQHTRLW